MVKLSIDRDSESVFFSSPFFSTLDTFFFFNLLPASSFFALRPLSVQNGEPLASSALSPIAHEHARLSSLAVDAEKRENRGLKEDERARFCRHRRRCLRRSTRANARKI
jgi:hypothetical protein